jgi:tetratricopeptide (TPR) repeat protein
MKKQPIALLMLLLFQCMVASAQEDGAKIAKSAGKALATYNMDRANNKEKLADAKAKIDAAMVTPEAQALPAAWLTRGDVYYTLLESDMAYRMINPKAPLSGDNDALESYIAYQKAYELAIKKYDKTDAVAGIKQVEGHLINIGVEKYSAAEYTKAFHSFKAALAASETLKGNNEKSNLDSPSQLDEITYFCAKAAQLAKLNPEAIAYYQLLEKKGTQNPDVYTSQYDLYTELNDTDKAMSILNEGRAKFPDDASLLFAEINVFIKANKLDVLTDRLKKAIAGEPTNVSLYTTLGSVYDQLHARSLEAKEDVKAEEYFNEALSYYNQGLGIDSKNLDANYSIGALYYNKAAIVTQKMNEITGFSSAELKKLNVLKEEVNALFNKALPYFQKSESIDPNDLNTLIALTEIYARQEDDLSIEFKKRLTVVKEKGKNETSFFKQ